MVIANGSGDKGFFRISRDHMTHGSGYLVDEIPSPYIIKIIVRATELSNKNIYVLQIGAALLYYKLRQTLLQIGAASLLQFGASVVTNWGS